MSKILTLLVIFASTSIAAQMIEAPEIIIVTGTKTDKKLKEGPVKTEVISEQEIREQRYRDAAEAIVDIPGVTLINNTAKIGKSAIIQGLGAEHVLVLIDGTPVMENSASGFDLSQISTVDIKQIEVVKGGASALYGGRAMGGVINIITKKPNQRLQFDLDIMKEHYTEGEQDKKNAYNLLRGHISGRIDKNAYKLSLTHQQDSSLSRDSQSLSKDSPDFEKITGNLWLERKLNEQHRIYGDINYYDENSVTYLAKPRTDGSFKEVHNEGEITGKRYKLGYEANLNLLKFQLYALKEDIVDELSMEDDPTTPYKDSLKTSELTNQRIESQLDLLNFESRVTTLGVVYNTQGLNQYNRDIAGNQTIEKSDVDDKESKNLEAYLQDDWIIDQHEMISGVRYTRDQYFGHNFSPKFNYSYNTSLLNVFNATFRASFGSGYRIPNLKERFYLLDHRALAGYILMGNENLRPETSQSYQFGAEISHLDRFTLSANIFFNNVKHLIVSKQIQQTSSELLITYENINAAKIRGLELISSLKLWDRLTLDQSFTYTRARNDTNGHIVPNRPFYLGQFNLNYVFPKERLRMRYTWRYYGDSYADSANTEKYSSYTQSDLRLNYRFHQHVDFYLGVRNIFNESRPPKTDDINPVYDQRPALGQTVFLGLNLNGVL